MGVELLQSRRSNLEVETNRVVVNSTRASPPLSFARAPHSNCPLASWRHPWQICSFWGSCSAVFIARPRTTTAADMCVTTAETAYIISGWLELKWYCFPLITARPGSTILSAISIPLYRYLYILRDSMQYIQKGRINIQNRRVVS